MNLSVLKKAAGDPSTVAELFGLISLFVGIALISVAVALMVIGLLILSYGLYVDLAAAKHPSVDN